VSRHLFGGDLSAWSTDLGDPATSLTGQDGNLALFIPGAVITFYNASSAGTAYTDLLDNLDTPITSVTTDAFGEFPEFSGPDGITSMWADGSGDGSGPRRKILCTDLGDEVPDGLSDTIDVLTDLTDQMPVIVRYDDGTASWPVRPAVAGTRVVFWLGPTPPPIDGTYMLDNTDFFFDWLP
jgi:hypothetical protein